MTKPTKLPDPEAFRLRLIKRRVELDLTQKDLAFPGCSITYLSRIENGQRTPSLQVIDELAGLLGVSSDWLIHGRENELALAARRVVVSYRKGTLDNELIEKLAELSGIDLVPDPKSGPIPGFKA
jgi:transcriptional regulator with XRE-family HTH domain